MKIAICEDNTEEASWLKGVIEAWLTKENREAQIFTYSSTEEFLFDYEEEYADVLFLDIRMPGEDGISLARKLRERNDAIPIVFVTGLDGYMSEGYEVEAVHYLVKPISADKVEECLERICQKLVAEEPYVILHTEEETVKIFQKDIIKVEVFERRCVYLTPGGEYAVVQSLKDAENELDMESFVSCYRGILVNLQHVEVITHDMVKLTGGVSVPVSRRMYSELNRRFIRFFRWD